MTLTEPYSMFPNRIIDYALSGDFSKNEIKIIFFILRHTYGFHLEAQPLSESFIAKGTGICQRWVHNAIKSLLERGVVVEVKPPTSTLPRELMISSSFGLPKNSPDDETVISGGDETVISRGDETVTQENKTINKNINKYSYPKYGKYSSDEDDEFTAEMFGSALKRAKERE